MRFRRLRNDTAQDTFEYVVTIGIVVALMLAGLLAFDGIVAGFLDGAICQSVDTAQQAAGGDCVN